MKEGLSDRVIDDFRRIILGYYNKNKRKFPFRETRNEYYVLVSEIMLQQTQTGAVAEKFLKFIELFPDFASLARASLEDVLNAWQGLGYNRRALALKTIAEKIVKNHRGKLPRDKEILISFPQIGDSTASSILAFAFNEPTVFIETNIRRVYLYYFFPDQYVVKDTEIYPIVEKTLD